MVRSGPFLAAALLAAALAAATDAYAGGPPPDLRLATNQKAVGDIAVEGEEDRIELTLVKGAKVAFTVKADRKSPLLPEIDLYDAAGQKLVIPTENRVNKGKKAQIRKFVMPSTGTFFIGIRGTAAGPTGAYKLTTKAGKPAKLPKQSADIGVADEVDEYEFDADAGALLNVTLKAGRKEPLTPRVTQVVFVGAGGETEVFPATQPVKVVPKKNAHLLKKLTLPSLGTYRVRVSGDAQSTGAYTLVLKVKPPKPARGKLDFSGGSGALPSGPPDVLEILPRDFAGEAGATLQLRARATYLDEQGQPRRVIDATRLVAWYSRDSRVATVANGTECGLATAVAGGGTTLEAFLGSRQAQGTLVLVGGATVTDVVVTPSEVTVVPGRSVRLHASAQIDGAGFIDVTHAAQWQATGTDLSLNGAVVTPAVQQAGTGDVTATAGGFTSVARTVAVHEPLVTHISLAPTYVELGPGGNQTFTATAHRSDGSTTDVSGSVTLVSDNLAVATISGTRADAVTDGTAGVRAVLDGIASAPSVVNCGPVGLLSVAVTGAPGTLSVGATADVRVEATFADGGTRDVTAAATLDPTDTAVIDAPADPARPGRLVGAGASGSADVTATLTAPSVVQVSAPVTIAGAAASRVALHVVPPVVRVAAGASVGARAFARLSDGSDEDVTASATWASLFGAVATVAADGSISGVADGGTAVTATLDSLTGRTVVFTGTGSLSGLQGTIPGAVPHGSVATALAEANFSPSGPSVDVTSLASWVSTAPADASIGNTGPALDDRLGGGAIRARSGAPLITLYGAFGGFQVVGHGYGVVAPGETGFQVFPQAPKAVVAFGDVQLAAQLTTTDGAVTDVASTSTWSPQAADPIATVNATGLVTPHAEGSTSIQAQSPSAALVSQAALSVVSDVPEVTDVDPDSVDQGATGVVLTITGTDLDGTNPSVSLSGSGITVNNPPNVIGPTSATVSIDVAGNAATGPRTLSFTTTSGTGQLASAVTVAAAAPMISGASPANVVVPATPAPATTVTVSGTGFLMGDTVSLQTHSGVTVGSTTFVNGTTLTAPVTVAPGTSLARLDLTVTQSAQNGAQSVTLTDGFKIGPPDPTITSVAPSFLLPGDQDVGVRVTGTNFGNGLVFDVPGGTGDFTISNVVVTGSTLITFDVDVDPDAAVGLFDLCVTNPADIKATFDDAFLVAPADPTVTALDAAALGRGAQGLDVEILGTGFRSGAVVTASGDGVSFSSVVVASPERITAKADVTSGAATGLRDLTVSHAASLGGRGGTLADAFSVTDAVPSVTSANPAAIGRTGSGGPTRRVRVELTGTDFVTGATVAVTRGGGSGLTVVNGSAEVLSATALVFELDLAGTTTTGGWDVTVTNPASLGDSGTSGNGALTVNSETTLTVNRVVPALGEAYGGDRVTVYGAGFTRGCQVEFGTQKALAAKFIDRNTVVCTVPPPADPATAGATTLSETAATDVDVRVTLSPLGSSSSATLADGFAYGADRTGLVAIETFPADQSTGVPHNLKSAVIALPTHVNTKTVVVGSTSGSHMQWFEAGGFLVSQQTAGVGGDRRYAVVSRSSGGNLPVNQQGEYILEIPVAVKAASGKPLTPSIVRTRDSDQYGFTLSASVTTDTTAPTVNLSPSGSAVFTTAVVTVTFNEEVDPLTITASAVNLKAGSTTIPTHLALASDLRSVTLTPAIELDASTQHTITVASTVADLFGNTVSQTTQNFTTNDGVDATNPVIDRVVFEEIRSDMDGSGTHVDGNGNAAAFDLYLPRSGFTVTVHYSDTGGAGIDASSFSAKASVAVGGSSANAELASKFDVTSTRAVWSVSSSDALTAGDDASLTFSIQDTAGNTSSQVVPVVDIVDIDATVQAAVGGDHDPFDARDTWVLRDDVDAYSMTIGTEVSGGQTLQTTTTTGAGNGVADLQDALRIIGLQTTNMTANAGQAVNGNTTGTNAIVKRLVMERVRAQLRARFSIEEDGTRDAGSVAIEFLLHGEQGVLSGLPTYSSSSTAVSGNAYSEMDIGGDTFPNNLGRSTFGTVGLAWTDRRNRREEVNLNTGTANNGQGTNEGVFCINKFKALQNLSFNSFFGDAVLKHFQSVPGSAGNSVSSLRKTGTPIGEGSLDHIVLAGSFDRTSGTNTQAENDRYDEVMDAIEIAALSISAVTAHEIGHSLGLTPDDAPPTGLFGDAHENNTFTEATAGSPNTSGHLNYVGNDIMAPASSLDDRAATGTDFMVFNPYDLSYLRHRQVHDEGQ